MASKASAVWTGSLKEGKGTISTATGVLKDANYSFATRFEGAASGTTPEEMIAAAHASCFSMALGAQLGGAGLTAAKIETQAAVPLANPSSTMLPWLPRTRRPSMVATAPVKYPISSANTRVQCCRNASSPIAACAAANDGDATLNGGRPTPATSMRCASPTA